MHDKLSEIVDVEVVGEVVRVGDAFFDVGLGRICLPTLSRDAVEPLLDRLRARYRNTLEIADNLNLGDSGAPLRGIVEVAIRDADTRDLYLLQITSHTVVAFYERRFVLAQGVLGDAMGTFYRGFVNLLASGDDGPLRILSGYDDLFATYLAHLDVVVRAAADGQKVDVAIGRAHV